MKILSLRLLRTLMAVVVLSVFCAGLSFADYAYYFPCFSNSDSKGELIGLALTNSAGLNAEVSVVVYDQNGVVKAVENWDLPPFGQKADLVGLDLTEVAGSFRVISNRPLTGLSFLFANKMSVMYDMRMTQRLSNKLDIPQIAQDAAWGMEIMVSNPTPQAVEVQLTYRDKFGQVNAHVHTVPLVANGSAVISLSEVLTGWGMTQLQGGCLHLVTSGVGVLAFSTFDNLKCNGSFYAGLLAVDPTLQDSNFIHVRSQYAVVSCSAPDYGSGVHALLEVEKPRSVQDNLLPTISDIKMAAQGNYFYRIARYNGDSVAKFAASAPATPIWQFSTMDASDAMATSNPQGLIFAPATLTSEAKAYIPRLESSKMWVVDPATTTEANFKIGEVELGDYADADGLPEMTNGVVVDGKLFLLLQRLDKEDGWAPQTPYLVVIDTDSNAEIDTQNGAENLKGIPLPIKNLWDIVYKDGKIYVNGVGSYASSWSGTPADYSGGIVSIDPDTYAVEMVVDDGDENEHPFGNISGLAVVSATRGYFISYAGWDDNAIYGFNPSTGVVDESALIAFPVNTNPAPNTGTNISALGVDGQGNLWVASNTFSGGGLLTIINSADDSVDQEQRLNLNPQGIAFGTWE